MSDAGSSPPKLPTELMRQILEEYMLLEVKDYHPIADYVFRDMIRDVAFSAPFMVLEIFDICHNMEKWHSTALEKQNCPTSHDICQHEVCEDLQEKIILLGNIKLDLDYTWKRLGNESLYQRYGLENTYKRGGNGSVYWRYAYEWHSDEDEDF